MDLDLVNAGFQLAGGWFTWKNAYQLWLDKRLAGTYWPTTAYFMTLGFWNLFLFKGLALGVSFWSGVVLVSGNAVWVALALVYRGRK